MTTAGEIISRAQAMAQGLGRYFTGKPCRRGHIAERRCPAGTCIGCEAEIDKQAARARAADWYASNRERALANVRAYRVANLEELRAKCRAYGKAKPHVNNAATRKYRAANLAEYKARNAAWKKANREKVCAYSRNRRAVKRAAEGFHTADDVLRILQAQKGKCAICRAKVGGEYDVDHIQPLAKGGSNWPANLQILCCSCNARKGARDPIEHARALGLLL